MTDGSEHIRSVALGIILTLVTFGLYGFWWQHKKMRAVNQMLGKKKYGFLLWLLFCVLTLGLYHIYHQYRMSEDVATARGRSESNDGLIAVVLCIFGLTLLVDAIQQSQINGYYGSQDL